MRFRNDFACILRRSILGDERKLNRRSDNADIVQFGKTTTPGVFKSKCLVHMGTLLEDITKK